MDYQLIGDLVSRFRNINAVIKISGEILWTSSGFQDLFEMEYSNIRKIMGVYGLNYNELLSVDSLKVEVNNKLYNLEVIKIEKQDILIIALSPVGDLADPVTRAYVMEQVISNLNDGVLLTDKDGRIVIYNKSMEEIEKKSSKEMVGQYIWDAYGYSDKKKSEHMEVFNTGNPIINKYKAHAVDNGNPIYKSYSTLPIEKDSDIIGVYSVSRNETKLQILLSEIVDLRRHFRHGYERDNNSNGTKFTFSDIIGTSEVMRKLIKESQALSWLDNSVLIVGDTGTGKEVFAQSIHNFGKYKSKPYIGLSCSAIPENLLEGILFGTVKGAYTGALDSPGLFEEVGDGTIFLDELNSMSPNIQIKLLRVLQERSVRRVGGKKNYEIRCRLISAMNEDPYYLIESGKLRQDLFYRIAGYNIYLPPLKDRGNDLFELSEYYMSKFSLEMNKNVRYMTDQLKAIMSCYSWPGNIRELENFIENIMIRTEFEDKYLRLENVPAYILDLIKDGSIPKGPECSYNNLQESMDSEQIRIINSCLETNRWNVSSSAKELGITRQSLIYRMNKFGIKRK